jgi:hypothetical protein
MSQAYTVKQDSAGLWCVWRGGTYLVGRMTLERAIKEAGKLARDHHASTGLPVTVDFDIAGEASLLTRYVKSPTTAAAAPPL